MDAVRIDDRPAGWAGYRWALWIVAAILANVLILYGEGALRTAAIVALLWVLPGLVLMEWVPAEETDGWERLGLGVALSLALTTVTGLAVAYLPGPLTRAQVLVATDALIGVLWIARLPTMAKLPKFSKLPAQTTGLCRKFEEDDSSNIRLVTLPEAQTFEGEDVRHLKLPEFSKLRKFHRKSLALLAILILAAFFRFADLGYSEFQGDEALVTWSAARAIGGEDDILFLHGKSPSEVLAPAQVWVLDRRIDETKARLPFAWASLAAVLGAYLLGRRWLGTRAGLIAALLFAINGYFIGFARVVQYQSWVVALSLFAIYAAYRAWADRLPAYQLLSALLLGGALLAHYDGLVAAPVVLAFWLLSWRQRPRGWVIPAASLALVVALAAAYYAPFVLSPQFGETASYLGGSRVGSAFLNNNVAQWLLSATVYNSSCYVALCLLCVLGLLAWALRRWPGGWVVTAALTVGMAATVASPAAWQVGPVNLAFAPFALAILAAALSPRSTSGERTAWAWFGVSLVSYVFVLARPLSHVYAIAPAWLLLAAFALDRLVGVWWPAGDLSRIGTLSPSPQGATTQGRPYTVAGDHPGSPPARSDIGSIATGAVGILILAVLAFYPYAAFVRHRPEFRQAYIDHPVPGYWRPYGQVPEVGLFGFPHRSGWKVIGYLYDEGVLKGDYLSNEEEWVSLWYTHFAPTSCTPDARYYFIARNPWDASPVPRDLLDARYAQVGAALADRQPRLEIWGRRPIYPLVGPDVSAVFDVDAVEAAFDAAATPDRFVQKSTPDHRLDVTLRGEGTAVTLLGYDVESPRVLAGQPDAVTLYWRAGQPIAADLHVVVRLDGDAVAPQVDTVPVCGRLPTTLWRPGQVVIDRHRLDVRQDAPAGRYAVTAGLYAPQSGRRLEPAEVGVGEVEVMRSR